MPPGLYLPGMIDDQVHFREPGLTHKGTLASESRAAVAGGYHFYGNAKHQSTDNYWWKRLEAKYELASQSHCEPQFLFWCYER